MALTDDFYKRLELNVPAGNSSGNAVCFLLRHNQLCFLLFNVYRDAVISLKGGIHGVLFSGKFGIKH